MAEDSTPSIHEPSGVDSITVFVARRIVTMDESLPEATAVAVSQGRIVAVGSMADMDIWRAGRKVVVDDRLADCVLMPGFVDNHIHPFLGAILQPMVQIAPEPWRQADGRISPAARTPEDYRERLLESHKAHSPADGPYITWGYQPNVHGLYDRESLDRLFPDQPVILWHRSFHETFLNSAALASLGLERIRLGDHPQMDWDRGHFFETGFKPVLQALMPHFLRQSWYQTGLEKTVRLMQLGGITTCGDMLFGAISPEYEVQALEKVLHAGQAPLRVVNVFDVRSFANRATGRDMGPPETGVDFTAGLAAIEPLAGGRNGKIWNLRAVKLFADGAMFSQLMQLRWPGYVDGHHGEWLMAPPVLREGVLAAWRAGYGIHVHVNGDAGMDAVLTGLEAAQAECPRFDHRFLVHHVGFHAQAQTGRLAALGAHASVNPYYLHALADDYSLLGLGPERAAQITRCGSMRRAGMRVSFHSDFMMAPPEPLALAWCAANRITRQGRVMAASERLTLDQALRGITIDAAWALRLEDEIGSIAAGKRADFAVLLDDPMALGVEQLHEVRVAGTVFEGELYLSPEPLPSTLSASVSAPTATGEPVPRARYRAVADACGGGTDRCDLVRQWAGWMAECVRAPKLT